MKRIGNIATLIPVIDNQAGSTAASLIIGIGGSI